MSTKKDNKSNAENKKKKMPLQAHIARIFNYGLIVFFFYVIALSCIAFTSLVTGYIVGAFVITTESPFMTYFMAAFPCLTALIIIVMTGYFIFRWIFVSAVGRARKIKEEFLGGDKKEVDDAK